MPRLPKRELDFTRFARSDKAKELLAQETIKHWGKILGWDAPKDSQSQPTAGKSKSKK